MCTFVRNFPRKKNESEASRLFALRVITNRETERTRREREREREMVDVCISDERGCTYRGHVSFSL